jgi:regulator of nonsense transcripts 3
MAPPTHQAAANGVLPAPAVLLKKKDGAGSNTTSTRGPRKPAERLKVIIRRLPPGLTAQEFNAALGDEWKVGAGKVNWADYKPGKISVDFSKPSRPARAYLNVTEEGLLAVLKEKVVQANFTDAKGTGRDAALIGPPTLEYAPCTRVPLGKRRTDARQGTIDQDPEFIDFLQSLTNPVTKPAALDAEPAPKKEGVTTTPLIEHLREKKAAKEKAGKTGKAKQQQDTKETKGEKANKKGAKGQAETSSQQEKPKKGSKVEKAAKEAVKVLNKEAASVAEKAAAISTSAKDTPEKKPERAARPISVAARIQQDLGLSPAARRAKREANAENSSATTAAASTTDANGTSTPATQTPKQRGPRGTKANKNAEKSAANASADTPKPVPTGPAQPTLLKKPAQPPKGPGSSSQNQPNPPKGPKAQQASAQSHTAASSNSSNNTISATTSDPKPLPRQAFLKHANPSQGITEPLIEEALKPFGAVTRVEIDRKKGFAYVDFVDNEGMKHAIAASPIKVAQGAVEVNERKDKQGGSVRGQAPKGPGQGQRAGGAGGAGASGGGGGFRGGRSGRGGRGGGGGRGGNAANAGAGSPAATNTTPTAPAASSAAVPQAT